MDTLGKIVRSVHIPQRLMLLGVFFFIAVSTCPVVAQEDRDVYGRGGAWGIQLGAAYHPDVLPVISSDRSSENTIAEYGKRNIGLYGEVFFGVPIGKLGLEGGVHIQLNKGIVPSYGFNARLRSLMAGGKYSMFGGVGSTVYPDWTAMLIFPFGCAIRATDIIEFGVVVTPQIPLSVEPTFFVFDARVGLRF